MGNLVGKKERQKLIIQKVKSNPFLTDEELAQMFNVSIHTVRFDRAELGIKEYRERIKNVAKGAYKVAVKIPIGEMLDMDRLHECISIMPVDENMTFDGTDMIKGQYIYAFAENLAIELIGAKTALIKVANIKHIRHARVGDKLVAKAEVKRIEDNEYIVWVKIKVNLAEVFRSKFMLKVL